MNSIFDTWYTYSSYQVPWYFVLVLSPKTRVLYSSSGGRGFLIRTAATIHHIQGKQYLELALDSFCSGENMARCCEVPGQPFIRASGHSWVPGFTLKYQLALARCVLMSCVLAAVYSSTPCTCDAWTPAVTSKPLTP